MKKMNLRERERGEERGEGGERFTKWKDEASARVFFPNLQPYKELAVRYRSIRQ
jgi:hypothetical protein